MKRAPVRAWLVTGPVGRVVGFSLDFAREMWAMWARRRRARTRRGADRRTETR